MPVFFPVEPIAQQLASGQLVLCSNQRLASRLVAAYAEYCREQGRGVVKQPRVFSLQAWIKHCWQQWLMQAGDIPLDRAVLTEDQELLLWESVIDASGIVLLRPAATAQQISAAYRILCQWQLNAGDDDIRHYFEADEDCAAFMRWAKAFEQRCEELRVIPAVRCAELLATHYPLTQEAGVQPILLVGFDSLSPAEQHFLDKAGQWQHWLAEAVAENRSLIACDNPQQEWLAAAIWAKQQLKNEPSATVAVVVPDLVQHRPAVQRVFQQVFEPEFNDPAEARRSLPFNLSAGYPLIDAPLVAAALASLGLQFPEIDSASCLDLLSSPFLGLEEEHQARDQLIDAIYQLKQQKISAAQLRQLTDKIADRRQGWQFAEGLQQQATLLRAYQGGLLPGEWPGIFIQLLEFTAWPGKRELDSEEYQQLVHWVSCLESLGSLDDIVGKLDFVSAVALLKGLLTRQVFQSQSADSALQVLGTLEAAGLHFSHLWVCGVSDQQWPATPSPNAFIPYALQRAYNMPHATASRELEFSRDLLKRFESSSRHIIASYCSVLDDNPANPSALLEHFQVTDMLAILGKQLGQLDPKTEIQRRHLESRSVDSYSVGIAPAVQADADKQLRGGTGLIADQSACPFRAFAIHRLFLDPLPEPQLGLTAADRGSLIHKSLEGFWAQLKHQSGLMELQDEELLLHCEQACDYALNHLQYKQPGRLGPRFRALEKQRMVKLLQSWMELEKSRAEFEVIETEQQHSISVGGLELRGRIDRVDRLADGSLLIIDYKTASVVDKKQWWGSRPDEPQLPLYAESMPAEVSGIAFAQLHPDKKGFYGIGDEEGAESSIRFSDKDKSPSGAESWQQLRGNWRRHLADLANEFVAGKAAVSPKNPLTSCRYCALKSVCRIDLESQEASSENS